MTSTVFVVGKDNSLTELPRTEYATEDLLQRLIADHPKVLAHDGAEKLLLVRREAPVPDELSGGARWSLDHLFLDGNGVPVLVEVKRASDTRIRREVVAQMLDYAANGVSYWPIEHIIEGFTATAVGAERDAEEVLQEFLGDGDPEAFWRQVEANLRSGRIRMVFVADIIPKELRRIVEFLNEQMRPAEVLAIEVEQFATAEGLRVLAPKVLGDTQRAQSAKAVGQSLPPISVDEWVQQLEGQKGKAAALTARRVIEWGAAQAFEMGVTRTQGSVWAGVKGSNGKLTYPFFVSERGVWFDLYHLSYTPAYASEDVRRALIDDLKALPGVTVTTTKLTGQPAVSFEDLQKEGVWDGLQPILVEVRSKIEAVG